MTIALIATAWVTAQGALDTSASRRDPQAAMLGIGLLVVAVLIGGSIGLWRARVVEMTGMPELIALLHSFVGLAAVLVGWNGALYDTGLEGTLADIHHAEVFIGVFIGAVTFTGSIVAFLKLSARMSSKPLMLPGKNALNIGALVAFVALTVWYVITPELWLLVVVTVLALLLGWHLVASIGGGDMPVVVSMLNSYSGWAAAAAGFLLNNDLLIITGALVGLVGCVPELHHVQGDEPVVPVGHRGRLRHRGAARVGRDRRRAPRDRRRRASRSCWPRHPASSSRPATAWPSRRRSTPSPSSPRGFASAASTCGSASIPSPAACPGT